MNENEIESFNETNCTVSPSIEKESLPIVVMAESFFETSFDAATSNYSKTPCTYVTPNENNNDEILLPIKPSDTQKSEDHPPNHEPFEEIPLTPSSEDEGMMITKIGNAKSVSLDQQSESSIPGPSSIIEFDPDGISASEPQFTEPETIEAMSKLGYLPRDLVLYYTDLPDTGDNDYIRNQLLLEMDRRRKQFIQNVIDERNKIIQAKLNPDKAAEINHERIPKPKKIKKRKKHVKKGKSRKKHIITPHSKRILELSKKAEKDAELLEKKGKKLEQELEKRKRAAQDEIEKKRREMQKKLHQQERKVIRQKKEREKEDAKKARSTMAKLDQAERRRKKLQQEKTAELKEKARQRELRKKKVEKEAAKIQKSKEQKAIKELKKIDKRSKIHQAKIMKPGPRIKKERILPPPGCLRKKIPPLLELDDQTKTNLP